MLFDDLSDVLGDQSEAVVGSTLGCEERQAILDTSYQIEILFFHAGLNDYLVMDFVSSVQVHFEWTFEPGDEDRVSETIFHNLLNIPNQYPSIQIKITILINAEESASTFCCFHLSNTSF